MNIRDTVAAAGGAVSAIQLAEMLGVDPAEARLWAKRHGVTMLGNSFVFTPQRAQAFANSLFDDEKWEEVDDDDDGYDDDEDLEEEDDEYEEVDEEDDDDLDDTDDGNDEDEED